MATRRFIEIHVRAMAGWLAVAWFAQATTAVPGQDQLAIQGGRILTMAGEPLDDGTILIREGRITAIGKGLEIPVGAKVIDAKGKVIMPGFIEAHSALAMSQANEVNPNVPFLSVVDTIDPGREYFEECRRNGVTTVAVVPGNSTMIGGQAAIIKTAGGYVDRMILKRNAGMKISLSPSGDGSRMGHFARLRRELERARESMSGGSVEKDAAEAKPAAGASDSPNPAETPDANNPSAAPQTEPGDPALVEAQRAAMISLLKGEFPAIIYCGNGMDVVHALRLTETYKLKSILVLGRECYEAAEQIAASKLPVVLDDTLVYWKTNERTGDDEKIVLPKIYREKGIPITFQVSGSSTSTLGNSFLWYQAATAVKYGMPVDEALQAITRRPAELLGVAEFVGTLEPGKDADLVVLSGDPLKVNTWVETTVVNGQVVYERSADEKIKRLIVEPKK